MLRCKFNRCVLASLRSDIAGGFQPSRTASLRKRHAGHLLPCWYWHGAGEAREGRSPGYPVMSAARQLYVVCYDIASPKRLQAALHLVRHYASGGQKSVHECWLSEPERGQLLAGYAWLVDEGCDRILLARLDPRRTPMFRGAGRLPTDDDFLMVA